MPDSQAEEVRRKQRQDSCKGRALSWGCPQGLAVSVPLHLDMDRHTWCPSSCWPLITLTRLTTVCLLPTVLFSADSDSDGESRARLYRVILGDEEGDGLVGMRMT